MQTHIYISPLFNPFRARVITYCLKKSHESCGTEMTDESIGLAFDQEHLRSMQKLEEDVRPIIQEMTAVEVMVWGGGVKVQHTCSWAK
jgi:hypothetical protein